MKISLNITTDLYNLVLKLCSNSKQRAYLIDPYNAYSIKQFYSKLRSESRRNK